MNNKQLIEIAKRIYIANKSDVYYSEITNCLFQAYLHINNLEYSQNNYEYFINYAKNKMPELKKIFEHIISGDDYLELSEQAESLTFEEVMAFDYNWFKSNLDLEKYFEIMLKL